MSSSRTRAGSGFQIGQVLGIPVFIDWSWLVIFAVITLLNARIFGEDSPTWPDSTRWLAAVLTSLLYFLSIFLHEVGHSVVARHYKIQVTSITLFIFGGVAAIRSEPKTPREEFWIALAGPAVSFFLALLLFGVWALVSPHAKGSELASVIEAMSLSVAQVNTALVLFNLLPGFPLDGGRIFRAVVWAFTGNFLRSTKIAGWAGRAIAVMLILFGITMMILQRSSSPLWTILIAVFIYRAAGQSIQRAQLLEAVSGVRARDLLDRSVPAISPAVSLRRLFESYIVPTGQRRYLVYDGTFLRGLITAWDAEGIPGDEWENTSVQAAMVPCADLAPVALDAGLDQLMMQMEGDGLMQVPVVESGIFYGLVTREGVLRAVNARLAATGTRL